MLAVSTDSCNQFANDILAVPRSTTLRPSPTDVYLPAGPGGISLPSMAKCELIAALDKIFLARGPLGGQITSAQMREIEKAIMRAIAMVAPPASCVLPDQHFHLTFKKVRLYFPPVFRPLVKPGLRNQVFKFKRRPAHARFCRPITYRKGSSWQNE